MKKRVFFSVAAVTSLGVLSVSLLLCVVFYRQYTSVIRSSLKSRAENFAGHPLSAILPEVRAIPAEDMRVTVVTPGGSVSYDNTAGDAPLDNHGGRKEIRAAFEYGRGESARFSDTLGEATYYYAVRLADGSALRFAKTTRSVAAHFASAMPFALAVTLLVILISYGVAGDLARRIERVALQLTDLKNAEKMRREFSANVSHELKTPLTSISGYAEMLTSGMVRERDKADFLQKIKDESGRLIALVEDIMLLSQLDEAEVSAELSSGLASRLAGGGAAAGTGRGKDGRVPVFEPVDIAEIAAGTAEALGFKAAEHLVTVEVDAGPVFVQANRSMMAQLFFNLIDNAIKYNRPGGTVTARFTQAGDRVTAAVADTGIGIPKKAQGRVFERFYRVDKSRSKKTGGTGLGLAIVKHIAIMHGAEVILESREGEGTTVTVLFNR